jgi:hypothetical protein
MGERSIKERDFGKIQKDRLKELGAWSDSVRRIKDNKKAKFAIAAANNHYPGFGSATANSLE